MQGSHVMVDIETLSTGEDATIVAIGAVKFGEPISKSSSFKQIVHAEQGRAVDVNTVLWWLKQDKKIIDEVFQPQSTTLSGALILFRKWAEGADNFWSWPASFDLKILDHAYANCGVVPPWESHRQLYCAMTVCSVAGVEREVNPNKHDPVADAAVQAVALQESLRKLGSL